MSEEHSIAVRTEEAALAMPSLGGMMKMAETLIQSGFLPAAIKTPAQAVAIMITGQELKIPTMQALRQINVIQGKPTMSAELMLALAFQRVPGFKCHPIESTEKAATFEFQRPGQPAYRHTFTINDAAGMGLVGKDNWKKQPATMLRWRCISAGLRLIAPDAIAGVYTPEEIQPDIAVDPNTGAAIVTQNTPVAMPVAKEADKAAPAEPNPNRGEESQVQPERLVIIGTVDDVVEKSGKDKNGKAWTKFGVVVNDASGKPVTLGTFDTRLADLAQRAMQKKVEAELEYQDDGKYLNLVGIRFEGSETDELPM